MTPKGSGAGQQTDAVPIIEPIFPHCFSCWGLKVHLSPEFDLTPSLPLKLSRLYSGFILRFCSLWLMLCSVCKYLFGTSV